MTVFLQICTYIIFGSKNTSIHIGVPSIEWKNGKQKHFTKEIEYHRIENDLFKDYQSYVRTLYVHFSRQKILNDFGAKNRRIKNAL